MTFFFIFFKKENKNLKHYKLFFLMLQAKQLNSITTIDFSSIKLSNEIEIEISSFSFNQMETIKFKTSLNNQ
jgi:hypothetical protein